MGALQGKSEFLRVLHAARSGSSGEQKDAGSEGSRSVLAVTPGKSPHFHEQERPGQGGVGQFVQGLIRLSDTNLT